MNPLYIKNILKLEFGRKRQACLSEIMAECSKSTQIIKMDEIDELISDDYSLDEPLSAVERLEKKGFY